jgi:hypothetical protein
LESEILTDREGEEGIYEKPLTLFSLYLRRREFSNVPSSLYIWNSQIYPLLSISEKEVILLYPLLSISEWEGTTLFSLYLRGGNSPIPPSLYI